jgi:hypothetical protein
MGSHDFDPVAPPMYQQQPEIIEPKKGHGCFFYGCITALVLFVLVLIAIGVAGYLGYRAITGAINEYTDTAPDKLPVVTRSEDEMKDLHKKLDEFKAAMDSGKSSETLILTADDINALINEKEEYRGVANFSIDGDKITGKISFPLSKMKLPLVAGRYLNGTGTFRVSISNGSPVLNAESIEVKGKPVPEDFMKELRKKNLMEDVKEPDASNWFKKVESLEVKDGKIIIKSYAKSKDAPDEETKPADGANEKKEDAKAAEPTPPAEGEKTAPKEKPDEAKPGEAKPPADAPKPAEEAPKPLAA